MKQMIRSKTIAALALVAAFGVGAASAADLAPWPYTKAPALPYAAYNWAGLYVGGHVGGSWTNENWTNTANTTVFGNLNPGQGFSQSGTGVFGGGQLGYNWQASNYVFGLEGTVSGLNNHGSLLNTVFGARDNVFSWRSDLMATITGRAGFAANNNLFYFKGGYAGINNHLAVSDTVPPFVGSGSATQWHNGWTVGAGWEYGITQNWIVGLEYDYATFQTKSYELGRGAAPAVYTFDARPHDVQSAVARLSYKFSGPLVAKY
jgi:outer membrane immunogenic protein